MTSRRQFLGATASVGFLAAARARAARTVPDVYPFAEFEARIAKRDFRDMTKDMLPTPCMVVDLDMFKANVKHMADTAKSNGINVRPHVKVHKSVDVAKHQMAHGAVGLTCATIAEAELFSGSRHQGRAVDQAAGRRQQHPAGRRALEEGPHLHVRRGRRAGGGLGGRRRPRRTTPR